MGKIIPAFIAVIVCIKIGANVIPWPIPCKPEMTSAFADFRGSHFHSGIDIRTMGKVGFPVIAEEDCSVARIGVSVRGFGLALYVLHGDGTMRVYAHLDRFNDIIDKYVRAAQYSEKSYSIQLYPKQGEFSFRKGDTLCYTGETGVGYPHLHYEYRNKEQQIINPFIKGLVGVKDTRPPVIRSISLRPMDTASSVNGLFYPLVVSLEKGKAKDFSCPVVPFVWGKIGIGVREEDYADASNHSYNSNTVRLFVNNVKKFEFKSDSFAFHETRQIDLAYDLNISMAGNGAHLALYIDEGNRLGFYGSQKLHDGIVDFTQYNGLAISDTHEIKIEVVDFWGNMSTGVMRVKVGTTVVPQKIESSINAHRGTLLIPGHLNSKETPPAISFLFNGAEAQCQAVSNGVGRWFANFAPPFKGFGELIIKKVSSSVDTVLWRSSALFFDGSVAGRDTLYSDDRKFYVVADKEKIIHRHVMWIEKGSHSIRNRKELFFPDSNAYLLKPDAIYTEKNISVSLKSNKIKGMALYVVDRKGGISFLSDNYDNISKTYHGGIRRPSTIVLGVDTVPPAISFAAPKKVAGTSIDRKIKVKVKDDGSGIESDKSIVTKIDGKWVLNAYDFESDLIEIEIPAFITGGRHKLSVQVRDRVGNENVKVLHFDN